MKQILSRLFQRSERGAAEVDPGHLTRLARRYAVEQQQVPRDLLDLVALNYLAELPVPPQGQRFVIDRMKVDVRLEAVLPVETALEGSAPGQGGGRDPA